MPTVGGQSAAQAAYLAKRKEQWSAAMKQEYSDSRRLAASLASKKEYKGAPPVSLLARANFKRLGTVSITGQAVRGGSVGARSTIAQYLRTRRPTTTEDPPEEANVLETPADTPTEKQSSEPVWGGSWRADGPELHPVVVRVEEAEEKEEVDGGGEQDGDECKLTARESKPRPPAEPELSEEELAARKAAKKRAQEAKKSAREVAQQHHEEAKKKKKATAEGTAAKSLRPTSAKSTKSVRVDRAMEAATPAALRAAKKAQARSERDRVLKVRERMCGCFMKKITCTIDIEGEY